MAFEAVNLAGLPGVIRCLAVHHRRGLQGNCDASLSLRRQPDALATGSYAQRGYGAQCGSADSACRLHAGGSIE